MRAGEIVGAIVSRAIGRTRRVRGCTWPSSSIRLAAGTCTAARCDCSLTTRRAPDVCGKRERVGQRQRPVAVAAQDPVAAGLGASGGMRVDRAPLDDAEAFGSQRLDAEIVDAGADCGLDARVEQFLEDGEEPVLQGDAQGQHAVEELRDRRQFLAQASRPRR